MDHSGPHREPLERDVHKLNLEMNTVVIVSQGSVLSVIRLSKSAQQLSSAITAMLALFEGRMLECY